MVRQRLRVEGSAVASVLGRVLVVVLALALVYYGAMLVLLALKVGPSTVNDLSGYRSAYDYLVGLGPGDISSGARGIVAAVALVVALPCAFLFWRGLPRAHLTRHPVVLPETSPGLTEIQPRAIERAAEGAAVGDQRVTGVRARYEDDGVLILVRTREAAELVETLREVARLARESLARHQLDVDRVDVRLVSFNRKDRRELA